jgi:hypothetical protein
VLVDAGCAAGFIAVFPVRICRGASCPITQRCVLALLVLLPHSKIVHGVYRTAALLRAAVEEREP